MTGRGRTGWVAALGAAVASVALAGPAVAWPRSDADPGVVDRTVRDVLDGPRYASAQPSWIVRAREAVQQWVVERLQDVFGSGAGTLLAWVLLGLAVVVGVAVTARWLAGTGRGARGDDGPPLAVVRRRPPADWLADARAAEADGDLAEAVRCGYRAVVATLARDGLLEEVPGRTVGEYRAQVAAHGPERLDDFTRASDVFERVWYARRPAGPGDVRTVLSAADDVAGVRA